MERYEEMTPLGPDHPEIEALTTKIYRFLEVSAKLPDNDRTTLNAHAYDSEYAHSCAALSLAVESLRAPQCDIGAENWGKIVHELQEAYNNVYYPHIHRHTTIRNSERTTELERLQRIFLLAQEHIAALHSRFTPPRNSSFEVQSRRITAQDLPQVFNIEQAAFEYPWSINDYTEQLSSGRRLGTVVCADIPEQHNSSILAIFVQEFRGNCVHILNIAVRPDVHNRGIATALLRKATSYIDKSNKYNAIHCRVRETNEQMLSLLLNNKFDVGETISKPHEQIDEDEYCLAYEK